MLVVALRMEVNAANLLKLKYCITFNRIATWCVNRILV